MTTETKTNGTIWLGDDDDPMDGPPVLAGEDTTVAVERTDTDEVAIHATMPGGNNALVSLHMTRAQAALIGAELLRKSTD